jgi:hypothetical protein
VNLRLCWVIKIERIETSQQTRMRLGQQINLNSYIHPLLLSIDLLFVCAIYCSDKGVVWNIKNEIQFKWAGEQGMKVKKHRSKAYWRHKKIFIFVIFFYFIVSAACLFSIHTIMPRRRWQNRKIRIFMDVVKKVSLIKVFFSERSEFPL